MGTAGHPHQKDRRDGHNRLSRLIKSRQLPPALAGLLRLGPPRFGSSRNRGSPGSTSLNFGFRPSLALRRHPLGNACANVCNGLGAELPLGGRPFDPGPSRLLSCPYVPQPGSTHFALLPVWCSRPGCGRSLAAEECAELILQGINSFLDVRRLTQLFCCQSGN
jgi:hypothetical protein